VRVTITHADGRLEVIKLSVHRRHQGAAGQAARSPTHRLRDQGAADHDGEKRKDATASSRAPDATVMRLKMTAWGVFEGRWEPGMQLVAPVTLKVVARDNALNQRHPSWWCRDDDPRAHRVASLVAATSTAGAAPSVHTHVGEVRACHSSAAATSWSHGGA